MPHLNILQDLVLILAICLIAVYALRQLRIPGFVAFIAAGMVVGPGGLNLIGEIRTIEILAEIGVVFLLFAIGLRFSLDELWHLRWFVLGGGGLQVVVTIVLAAGLAHLAGQPMARSLFIGFLIASSSTAIVLRLLDERGETVTPQGRFILGVLIFQDLAVIPLMLLVPVLGQTEAISYIDASRTLLKSGLAVALIIVSAQFLIPWVMERIVHTRSRELFTFTALLIVLGTAYFAQQIGLSLALGALLAGIVISESQYSHQILAEVTPLRDALSSLFFVSVGMLLDPALWMNHPWQSLEFVFGTIVLKAVVVVVIALLFGQGIRISVLAGLGLAQVGEFSFVLAQAGQPLGLLPGTMYQQFLSISVLTMALTPAGLALSPAIAGQAQQSLRLARTWRRRSWLRGLFPARPETRPVPALPAEPAPEQLTRHVIIVGYGVNGRNVARVLRQMQVRFVVLELNPATVRSVREHGEPVIYGDATRQEILEKAGIYQARVLIVAIPDPRAARRVVAVARSLKGDLTIIVRTRFVAEVDMLREMGADEVVPEEFETSIALVGRVMAIYGASEQMIEQQEEMLRSEHYEALREDAPRALRSPALREMLAHADFAEITLPPDSPSVGQPIRTLDLRGRTGASIMGISRDRRIVGNPGPDFVLEAGDVVGVLGTSAEVAAAKEYLLHGGKRTED